MGVGTVIVSFVVCIAVNIFLNSFDVYSDLTLIIQMLNYDDPKFALALACPMIFSTLLTLPHWWKMEKNIYERILTFPLVLLLFYPQYKMIQVLYLGLWKKDGDWQKQKAVIEKNVSGIGEFYFCVRVVRAYYFYCK